MVSFQRMKDEFDGFSTQVSTKLPVVGRSGNTYWIYKSIGFDLDLVPDTYLTLEESLVIMLYTNE